MTTEQTIQASDYAGRIEEAGGFSREVKTYTVRSYFGVTANAVDEEVCRQRDGSLGWGVVVADVFHFDNVEDAWTVAKTVGSPRDGATVTVMEW